MHKFSLRTLLILAALALAISLSWRPLAMPDEGRYLSVAAAMWHSGDWVVPRLNGLPFFHKPPLFYWLAALSYGLSGGTVWAGRLAPWLGAVIGMLALAWLMRAALPGRSAAQIEAQTRWGVLALVLQPLWFLGAQYANLDMLVAGLITAAICALGRWALLPQERAPRWLALLAISLGVLAKGLIGVVLPVAVLVLWLLWERRWRLLLRIAFWPGWLLLPLLILPWFLLVEQRHAGFLHYFFIVQHFQRYVGKTFNNVMPFWFYPAVLLLLMLPWSPLLALRARRRAEAAPAAAEPASPDPERLAWVWLGLIT
ncbi:MAG: hypothetical protein RJA44_563, partial [Pseudomonadota bacterium]